MVGIDRWGREYARSIFALRTQCRGGRVAQYHFARERRKLDFPDKTFDAVTSNYVYHNIKGKDKQQLLSETLRVLKKAARSPFTTLCRRAIRRYAGVCES
ncbi:MAG: class I SAM-dependent methyltransferase [Christensenellaceae bacterium]